MRLWLALGTVLLGLANTVDAAASQGPERAEILSPALVASDFQLSGPDRLSLEAALQYSLERMVSGQAHSWQAAQGSANAHLTPLRTFRSASGHFCREYRARIKTGNRRAELHGIACRGSDAVWLVP